MNVLKKYNLRQEQEALMKERKICEQLQTEHSEDIYFYHYMQREMDNLDKRAEHIRSILEGRWTV